MAPKRDNSKRKWRLRLAAVALGLLPLVALEMSLRWLDLPMRAPAVDPFIDLHGLKPLFEVDPQTGRLHIGPGRMNLFRPASLELRKEPNAFRVFALGGSTTQGEPYSTETAFPKWLEINLQCAMPERRVEVINCGGLSYASYRVLAILSEVLQYAPDLIVVYTGQNEYLEKRSYEGYGGSSWATGARGLLPTLRIVQLLRVARDGDAQRTVLAVKDPTKMAAEVDALLDYQGGLEAYHRGDAWREPVVDHFQWNLREMVNRCRARAIPLVLVSPVTNLLDCPPIKFEESPSLSPARLGEFQHLWRTARERAALGRSEDAIAALNGALQIDPEHAGAHFLLGKLLHAASDFEAARQHLQLARDYDVCPLRATSAIRERMARVASDEHVLSMDAEKLFSERSQNGIVGEKWLVDHIHPSVEGHQLLAEGLADLCVNAGIVSPQSPDWSGQRAAAYHQHLATLGEEYFHRGKQRLEGLILWTQGRAKKVRQADFDAGQLP